MTPDSERVVVCDFCSAPLKHEAWDFPADDIDYGGPRTGPGAVAPVEGSIGAWIACVQCGDLVNRGRRHELAKRSADRLIAEHSDYAARFGRRALVLAVRAQQDRFWSARRGPGAKIGAEQIALIARDPPVVREYRPGPRPR